MTKASILIPAFNSEETIEPLVDEVSNVFQSENIEFVIVNDFSSDQTHEKCLKIHKKYPDRVIYIRLKKNYGEHNAVMAGLKFVKGKKIFIIDDDFQNSPTELKKLYDYTFQNDYDVVYTKYKKKEHNFLRNIGSKINDTFVNFILNKPSEIYLSSFKSIDINLVKEILNYQGPSPYIDGIIFNTTSKIGQVDVDHKPRYKGQSGYTFLKLLKLFSNVAFNFSTKPLRVISVAGFFLSFFSFLLGLYILVEKYTNPELPLGYASLVLIILFFSGLQLLLVGLLGEYLGRVLSVINKQPQYSIDIILNKKNLDE